MLVPLVRPWRLPGDSGLPCHLLGLLRGWPLAQERPRGHTGRRTGRLRSPAVYCGHLLCALEPALPSEASSPGGERQSAMNKTWCRWGRSAQHKDVAAQAGWAGP